MKKVLLVLLVISMLSSVSFAAKKSAVSFSESSSGMKIGMGIDNGLAALKFMSDAFSGTVGLFFQNQSQGGASNSTFVVGGKGVFNLTGGTVPTHAGAGLSFTSFNNGSTFSISGIYGAETTLADHLNVGVDIYPITFSSTSVQNQNSTTTFQVLTGTVYCYYLF
jgi:hypothetical protein